MLIHAESEKLAFPDGDLTRTLAPGINDVRLTVVARSNGVFPVVVELRTPAGNPVGEPVELTARVTALTGLGRLVTLGALIVLATWWFSYFRRRHLTRRDEALLQAASRHPAGDDPVPGASTSVTPPAAEPDQPVGEAGDRSV